MTGLLLEGAGPCLDPLGLIDAMESDLEPAAPADRWQTQDTAIYFRQRILYLQGRAVWASFDVLIPLL